jgi:hypothetical protein
MPMPRILKMPKPPPNNRKKVKPTPAEPNRRAESPRSVPNTTPLAEIVLFPNATDPIPGVTDKQTDPQTETRWLNLADDALRDGAPRKQA